MRRLPAERDIPAEPAQLLMACRRKAAEGCNGGAADKTGNRFLRQGEKLSQPAHGKRYRMRTAVDEAEVAYRG